VTGIPAFDFNVIARRIARRAFRHGVLTALRHNVCKRSLSHRLLARSTLSGVAELCRAAKG